MRTYTALGCKQIRHIAHRLITCKILDIDAIQEIEHLTQLYLKVLPEYTKRTFKIGGSGVVVNAFGLYPKNGEFESLLPHHIKGQTLIQKQPSDLEGCFCIYARKA